MPSRIMVADDNPGIRMLLQTILRYREDIIIDCAKNGSEVIALSNSNHYDLIILDIRMPDV
ncbi:response regulator, partial [Heliobacterium chlorum]